MRKIALVICEGETEENYINLLKADVAVERAKNLYEFKNPSIGVYKLIEKLKGYS